jgi:hypothetical protein
MNELDPGVADKADKLARWLADDAGDLRRAAGELTGPGSDGLRRTYEQFADFIQVTAASYQAARRRLKDAGTAPEEFFLIKGEVFTLRTAMEILAGLRGHCLHEGEAPTRREMSLYVVT